MAGSSKSGRAEPVKVNLTELGEILERMESVQRVMGGRAVDAITASRLQGTLRHLSAALPPPADVPAIPLALVGATPSGPAWVSQFPGSQSPDDCAEPFKTNLKSFLSALAGAQANVTISATLRPVQRAYLMHWSWMIARNLADPATVPLRPDVPIQWLHVDASGNADVAASRSAAAQMVAAYGIATEISAPALNSRHTEGLAVDMTISWAGTLTIADADGTQRAIPDPPRDGMNSSLDACGATYGVIKATFAGDKPHWSSDGS